MKAFTFEQIEKSFKKFAFTFYLSALFVLHLLIKELSVLVCKLQRFCPSLDWTSVCGKHRKTTRFLVSLETKC